MTPRHPLATFVPLLLERRLASPSPARPFGDRLQGAVLAADISGSTALASSLGTGPGAADRLGHVLGAGFRPLLEAVARNGGDVLGFLGDGLTAFWEDGPDAEVATASAVAAALEAQEVLRQDGGQVGMRTAVARGGVDVWHLGGQGGRWLLLVGGPAPAEAMRLEHLVAVGGVAVSDAVASELGSALVGADRDGVTCAASVASAPGVARGGGPQGPSRPGHPEVSVLEVLGPYLSPTVVARLAAGHDHYLSDLRTVTTTFVILPDLTLTSPFEPLQELVTTCQRVVQAHDSALNRIAIDEKGVTALIVGGLPPHAHEDDADRALMAALHLSGELSRLRIAHGVGVATGSCFCGVVGNDVWRDYTVHGDAVNVAARLATTAISTPAQNVLCDPSTATDTSGRWEFATPISLRLRGKTELLTAFPPVGRIPLVAPREVQMVGRTAELTGIARAITATSPVSPGRLLLVSGDPGIGKSRLVAEARRLATAGGRRVLVGSGDALHVGTPYQPWRQVFRDLLDLDDLDPSDAPAALERELGDSAPLVAPIVGVATAESALSAALAGERRVSATRQALISLLERAVVAGGTLTMVFEDAHWFDSGSWAMLGDAVGLSGVLAVVTARPLDAPVPHEVARLLGSTRTETIVLGPLSAEEVAELARAHLGVEAVAPSLRALLHDRCGGNPFFTAEVIKSLDRSGSLGREGSTATVLRGADSVVPSTIQMAITSRIDRLGQDAQLTLKVATVVGETFCVRTIAAIHPTRRDLRHLAEDLAGLTAAELVVDRPGEGAHGFKHALIRDSAYQLMLGDQRRGLHRRLAEHHEAAASGGQAGPAAPAAVLAHHWRQAGDDDKAVHYLRLASVDALAHGMPRESIDHGLAAAGILGIDLPTDPQAIRAVLPRELEEIDRLMAGRRPSDLAVLPTLLDERVGTAVILLIQAIPSAHQSLQTELFALMAIRNLNLTLRFGAGPFASGVYAMYSVVMRALGMDSRAAFEFSQAARDVDAANGHPLGACVAFVHVWFHNHWHHPMATGVPIVLAGADAGFSGGDVLYGCYNLATATCIMATSGHPLMELVECGERHIQRIGDDNETARFHCRLEVQMAKALAGRTASPTSLTDDSCDESELAAMAETDNFNQTAYLYIAKARLACLAGDSGTALDFARQAYELRPSFVGQVGEAELTVLFALARLGVPPRDERGLAEAIEDAGLRLAELHAWSECCPENFEHKARLVEAEMAVAQGTPRSADALYAAAVESAARNGFPQWAALGAERWGRSLLGWDRARARETLVEAAGYYRAWGSEPRARACEELAHGAVPGGSARPRSTTLHDTSGPSPTSATNGIVISS